jgi:hypothetical protein
MATPAKTLARAIEASENAKIGLSHATMASQVSCPPTCPLLNAGCYAENGNMGIHTRQLNVLAEMRQATPLDVARAEADEIEDKLSGRLDLRLHVVGDCATDEAAQIVSQAAVAKVRKHRRDVWSYTHAWRNVSPESWGGVSILASGESTADAKEAMDAGWAAAIVLPDREHVTDKLYVKDGVKILPCVEQTRGVKCVDCRLCMDAPRLREKGIVIGFAPHGSRFKVVQRMLAARGA